MGKDNVKKRVVNGDNMKNDILEILRRLRYLQKWICLYHRFGSFRYTSSMGKPLWLAHPRYIQIGRHVSILPLARMECVRSWQGETYNGELIIGDGTSIEQSCHIIAADRLEIGRNVTLSAFVYIADCNHSSNNPEKDVMEQPLEVKTTKIEEGAFIGIGARIMPGVTVGKHAIVGANAVVCKDVPDYCIAAGVPASTIKKYDFEKREWVALEKLQRTSKVSK